YPHGVASLRSRSTGLSRATTIARRLLHLDPIPKTRLAVPLLHWLLVANMGLNSSGVSFPKPCPAPVTVERAVRTHGGYLVGLRDDLDPVRETTRLAKLYGISPQRLFRGPAYGFF